MKLENVKVGEAYTLKVGRNAVQATVKCIDASGRITVVGASGKPMTVADAGRLSAKLLAHGAPGTPATSKAAKSAPERPTAQQGAPGAQETGKAKRTGLLDAAILVLRETGQPMNTKEMVDAVLANDLWKSDGKTPEATLYSSILREIQKKGEGSRFVKTERGKFALKY